MRILNFPPMNVPIFDDHGTVSSGREKVYIDVHELLHSAGHDVISFTREGCRFANEPGVLTRPEWQFERKYRAQTALSLIDQVRPTHVICHGDFPSLGVLTGAGIHCMFVDHQSYFSISNLSCVYYFERVAKNRELGGKLYDVSEFSIAKKSAMLEYRSGQKYDLFDGSIKFQFPTRELMGASVSPVSGVPCFVGRISKTKNVVAAPRWFKRGVIPDFLVMSNSKTREEVTWDEAVETYPFLPEKTLFDVPRQELLQKLGSAPFSLVTSPYESAGIAAFESLCLGVPILCGIMSHQFHAAAEFIPDEFSHFAFASVATGDKISDPYFIERCQNASLEMRAELRHAVLEYNSRERCTDAIVSKLSLMSPL